MGNKCCVQCGNAQKVMTALVKEKTDKVLV